VADVDWATDCLKKLTKDLSNTARLPVGLVMEADVRKGKLTRNDRPATEKEDLHRHYQHLEHA